MIEFVLAGTRHEIYYIYEGGHFTFRALAEDLKARGPAADTLQGKKRRQRKKPSPKDWKRLIATVDKTANSGYRLIARTNAIKTWTEDEGTEVYEFRKGNIRVFFFEDETVPDGGKSRLVITHAYYKQTDETPSKEIERFLRLRQAYYEWKLDAD